MATLSLVDDINEVRGRINSPEEVLGKGLMQPFNHANSGSRKIMFGTQTEHVLVLLNPELAIIETGYENRFGDYSASITKTCADYEVIAKISKFSFNPKHHYYLIMRNINTNELELIERISYHHITESYGYLFNNTELDNMEVGSEISRDTIIQKSQAFDEYDNRLDGINLTTTYMSCSDTIEDSIIISESAARKLTAPLIKKVTMIINDNDIPLNIYGNDNEYKVIPNVGEEVKNGILCAIRREKKEESLFSQSYQRLKNIMMSDEKFTVEGEVIDLNIYSNNPQNLTTNIYNSQLCMYREESVRFATEVVNVLTPLLQSHKLSYDLQKLFSTCNKILNGVQFIKERPFSNIIVEIVLLERNVIRIGDKLSNRYGGKGVVSCIRPQHLMPQIDNTGEYVEIIFNSSTCVNRLNAGQLFETSLTHIGSQLLEYLYSGVYDVGEIVEQISDFIAIVSPEQAEFFEKFISPMDDEDLINFISTFFDSNSIHLSIKPMSEYMTIEKLNQIYKRFPWIKQCIVRVPQEDSNGNIRYINARRKLVCGKQYIYRLKQYAEEKFSVTSLSATNIKNENSRSKANKNYKSLHAKTPIKFGEMEQGDFGHMGMEHAIVNLMIHSLSPHARRLTEQMLTGDPFNIDIKLDHDSKNRGVEILNTNFKTMGLKLVFKKMLRKLIDPITINPISFIRPKELPNPITFVNKDEYFDPVKDMDKMIELEELNYPITIYPITFLE